MAHTALIIDDEADIRELIAMSLDRIGLETHTAANLAEARNLLDIYKFDVCLSDMKLPDGNGLDFVKHVASVQPDLPVAIITAHGNMDAAVEAMKNGAFDFVSKPVDLGLLRSLVTQALKLEEKSETPQNESKIRTPIPHDSSSVVDNVTKSEQFLSRKVYSIEKIAQQSYASNQSYHDEFLGKNQLIGKSETIQELKKMIVKVARTNAPVWITGESGTGKELIANLVHENGPRSDSPFVPINCGAIPTELMESEMFGHRKGSFTGAHSNSDGLFIRAEGGTLFLDEVAELPLHMQVKLLRAIQERKIRPVGSPDELSTNVRILSASHKDLAAEVEQGRFRHDLYYRLNVICIRAPSLRQRNEDVLDIAQHILKSIEQSQNLLHNIQLSDDAKNALKTYNFPGNVRELENILERAVALSEGHNIAASDLSLGINRYTSATNLDTDSQLIKNENNSERERILNVLSNNRWNRKAAADTLGMTYRQLRYRIKQYDIENDSKNL